MKKLSITAIGQDQAGIVAACAQVLFQHGCNVEDTSMTILEDQFAMIFLVHVPETLSAADLESTLRTELARYALHWHLAAVETTRENLSAEGSPWMITVSGADQTGIMYHVTTYLAKYGINIRQLSSKRLTRNTGDKLFLMAIEADAPAAVDEDVILADLRALAGREQLEIVAEPLEVYTL